MRTRSGADITIAGDVVFKLHRPGTDPRALATRLRVAARLSCLLTPLSLEPEPVGERWRTRWPRVLTVPPDPSTAPWADAGRLLAVLHAEILRPGEQALVHGGPDRLRRAVAAIGDADETIRRAAAALPELAWLPGSPARPHTPVHGDWHLGQLGRFPTGPWQLLDVDDLGAGDPAWDLARPAGFWAAGLLPDADWASFLGAYRDAGGLALPPAPEDPWPALDGVARAAVVQAAARGAVTRPNDDAQAALVEACARMTRRGT